MDKLKQELALHGIKVGQKMKFYDHEEYRVVSRTKTTITIEPLHEVHASVKYDFENKKEVWTTIKDGKLVSETRG